mmetsp:Transcript_49259/g.141619  ORF Transcript_49259/g.141619 Transcript_49259/m.141619 type:complete len:165 (-) Transcript_49259:343-837(-)|eukprot:CAMPEP_0176025434 /NCGR_PEP_ID=MMETSP0120_2-20121206/12442_1 /TAXON_ID=160619 /ORGANISM="Kryptoperidinium foliaceum, Strain CCMP 1326" /LENGTH=164 /DNA_ID=CAMNT_0017358617 /DNA_START=78 /DNA_END=572 /DNA_ORIENTATION=+
MRFDCSIVLFLTAVLGQASAFSSAPLLSSRTSSALKATDEELREGASMGMVDPEVSRINQVRSSSGAMQLARSRDFSPRPMHVPASFESLDFGPEVRTRDQMFKYLEYDFSRPDIDLMGGPEVRTRDQRFARLEAPHYSPDFDVQGGPEFRTRLQSPSALGGNY